MRSLLHFLRRPAPFAWLLVLCLSCGVVACKSLPDVEPEAPAKAVPTIATTKGTLPPNSCIPAIDGTTRGHCPTNASAFSIRGSVA